MSLSHFTPRVLTGVITHRPINPGLFTSFFKDNAPSAVETFELEKLYQGQSILPTLSNSSAGTMRDTRSIEVVAVTAPRFRPKRLFSAADKMKKMAGYTPYDTSYNPVEKAVADDMDDHIADIELMKEIMCSQALVNGKIELFDKIEGTVKKTKTIDFLRPSSHSVTLSSTATWDNSASNIIHQSDEYSGLIFEATSGFGATDLILGAKAWELFSSHEQIMKALDNRNYNIGSLNIKTQTMFKGVWNGLNIFVSYGKYMNIENKPVPYIPSNMALYVARNAKLEIEYGLPVDIECEGPTRIFAKQFKQDDPSGIFTIAESRPLPLVKHNGATVAVTVCEE